jgi:sulfonate transport system substrate-binding protein
LTAFATIVRESRSVRERDRGEPDAAGSDLACPTLMGPIVREIARRLFVALVLATAMLPKPSAADPVKEIRIGYQKIGALLALKGQGTLEKRLAAQGVTVKWVEFQSGPPLIEALNAGSIDFGYTGDTPPLFAQAAGVDFVYVAAFPSPGHSSAIVVRDASGITSLADLRGKKIAVTKGSSAQNVLVHVLAKAGVAYGDVQPVYLQPADAGAALRNGSVDAWSIWDPFFALAEAFPGVHVLTTAYGIAPSNNFFLASRSFATANPAIVHDVIDETQRIAHWAQTHQADYAQVLSDASGVYLAAEKKAVARGDYEVVPLTAGIVKQEQAIADAFTALGLLPHPIVVQTNVWAPDGLTSTAAR